MPKANFMEKRIVLASVPVVSRFICVYVYV